MQLSPNQKALNINPVLSGGSMRVDRHEFPFFFSRHSVKPTTGLLKCRCRGNKIETPSLLPRGFHDASFTMVFDCRGKGTHKASIFVYRSILLRCTSQPLCLASVERIKIPLFPLK